MSICKKTLHKLKSFAQPQGSNCLLLLKGDFAPIFPYIPIFYRIDPLPLGGIVLKLREKI
jgi:hypothetical protein